MMRALMMTLITVAVGLVVMTMAPRPASAVYTCGSQHDDYNCGSYNPYPCCDNGGNCTWWSWDQACRKWDTGLPPWGNAKTWAQNAAANPAYQVLSTPVVGSIAVRSLGTYGHVAWVTGVNGSTLTVSEMNCDISPAGPRTTTYDKSFFNAGFIVKAGTSVTCSTANGAMIKATDSATVYYMLNGRRWNILNEAVLAALGLNMGNVCAAPPATVNAIPLGPKIGFEGSMFLCPTCASPTAVYLIQGGQRHHIQNEWVLQTCLGLSLNDVFTKATQAFMNLYPVGDAIVGDCQPGASENTACGNCGQQTRSCSNSCHWGSWSGCSGQGECAAYATTQEACGNCGQRQRSCSSSCSWQGWSTCSGQGECAPYATTQEACGNCGQRQRNCSASCSWQGWSTCSGQGECAPYATTQEACGNCGQRQRNCSASCSWQGWTSCGGEGECAAGAQQAGECGLCGDQTRTCSGSCAWQGWSQCADEGSCQAGASEQRACGRCGQQQRGCDGSCGWSDWGACAGEGACTPGESEQRACSAGCGVETRSCGASCQWGAWGGCSGVAPCVQGTTESEACGACGTRTRSCLGCTGWGAWSGCSGEGPCAPGDVGTEACGAGCAEHARTCSATCAWSAWGACPSEAVACDDAKACTVDACVGASCQHTPVPLCCADGTACPPGTATVSYTCEQGVCKATALGGCETAANCVDGDPCTTDVCDAASGACQWPVVAECCRTAADCADADACTVDSCGADQRCAHGAVACGARECSADGCCGSCAAGASCDAQGVCVATGPGGCDDAHTTAGRCDGEVLSACIDGEAVERDCTEAGLHCGLGSASPAVMGCVAGCGAATEAVCVGATVHFCVAGAPWVDDCARYGLSCGTLPGGGAGCVETCASACPPGTHCEGTSCAANVAEPSDPVDGEPVAGSDPGGCGGGRGASGALWVGCALLLLGAWARGRRRRAQP